MHQNKDIDHEMPLPSISLIEDKLQQLLSTRVADESRRGVSEVKTELRTCLLACLEQVCKDVPLFNQLSKPDRLEGEISIDTVREAILNDYFTSFQQFEYALFRVIEQHKQKLFKMEEAFNVH
jgi:hypothetical protein